MSKSAEDFKMNNFKLTMAFSTELNISEDVLVSKILDALKDDRIYGAVISPASQPEGREEAVAVLGYLLQQSSDEKIDMVDGDFYWSGDKDGDQPLDENDIYKMFKNQSPLPPSKEQAAEGVEQAGERTEMEIKSSARLYAESIMSKTVGEDWDRRNDIHVGNFYKYFIDYLFKNHIAGASWDAGGERK